MEGTSGAVRQQSGGAEYNDLSMAIEILYRIPPQCGGIRYKFQKSLFTWILCTFYCGQ